MLGRGALATPDLAAKIKAHVNGTHYTPLTWENVVYHILHSSMHQDENMSEKYFSARTKQWLSYLKRQYSGAHVLFDEIKTLKSKDDVMKVLQKYAMSPDLDSNHNSEV